MVAVLTRGPGVLIVVVALFAVFVPFERVFARRRQRVLRAGLATDLTHFLADGALSTIGTVALLVVVTVPLFWLRRLDLESHLPGALAVGVALVVVFVGNYWGHRLAHTVPFLWRFHAVHHSIEEMDWMASGRLHPLDAVFTQAWVVVPLYLVGYDTGALAGIVVGFTALALFQHANVRLRFPRLRWVINTPEWHHWHHAVDAEARDKNFGLPVVDLVFRTAYMPRDRRPSGFGTEAPVPRHDYLRHLAYPFTSAARTPAQR